MSYWKEQKNKEKLLTIRRHIIAILIAFVVIWVGGHTLRFADKFVNKSIAVATKIHDTKTFYECAKIDQIEERFRVGRYYADLCKESGYTLRNTIIED